MSTPPDRRRAEDPRLDAIEQRLDEGAKRMQSIEDQLARNTEITAQIRDALIAWRVARDFFGWTGAVMAWLTKAALFLGAVYAAGHAYLIYVMGGGKPPTH